MPARRELTEAELRFISEYLIDDNGTRAYRVAHPEAAYTTCRTNSRRLLAKAYIQKEIKAQQEARQKRTRMRADSALKEAARIAYSDPLYLFEDDGCTPRNMRDIPPDTRRAIAEIKTRRERIERRPSVHQYTCVECGNEQALECEVLVTYETISYKLWPKPKGLDKVFAHLGLTREITPLDSLLASLPDGLARQVREYLERSVPGESDQAGTEE